MKVVLHGFGTFPIVFYHIVEYARRAYPDVEWAIILTTAHHESLFVELLGRANVVVLPQDCTTAPAEWSGVEYPRNLFRDIEAEKQTLKHRPGEDQCLIALSIYRGALAFMESWRPDAALVSQVEGFDGKAFIAAAEAVGATVVVPTDCRNIGGTYFATDDQESLPPYADASAPDCRALAERFVSSYRASPSSAHSPICVDGDELLERFRTPLPRRAVEALRRWIAQGRRIEPVHIRVSVQNNLPFLRNAIWALRRWGNQRHCDIGSLEELPGRFIYYPLQYSPESSINTPAPYFVDQLRAIDAIRFSMPSGYRLVVKEHPACIVVRSSELVKRLRRTAGVIVAHYRLPSSELIKRACVTVSVTGTATLEALFLGRQAIALGNCLSANLLDGSCTIEALPKRISAALANRIADDRIIDALAKLYSVRRKCTFSSPDLPGEPVLRRLNIQAFTDGLMEHCRKMAILRR